MRVLGLDLGSRVIGMAVSDELGWTAQGLPSWKRRERAEEDIAEIKRLVSLYKAECIVVGYPRNMDGSAGPAAQAAAEFADRLQEELGIKVVLWDERMSTVAAERVLLEGDVSRRKRRQAVDKLAAVIILQGYLDRLRHQKA